MPHHPGRRIGAAWLLLNHTDRKQILATSSNTPPPKKHAACEMRLSATAKNSATPIFVIANANRNTYYFVPRMISASFLLPVRRLQVDDLRILLNVRKIQ